jgi:hypothetical protein
MVYDNNSAVASKEAAGAPETEIEITPAMIEAGVQSLADIGCSDNDLEVCAEVAFRAMWLAIHKAPTPES